MKEKNHQKKQFFKKAITSSEPSDENDGSNVTTKIYPSGLLQDQDLLKHLQKHQVQWLKDQDQNLLDLKDQLQRSSSSNIHSATNGSKST